MGRASGHALSPDVGVRHVCKHTMCGQIVVVVGVVVGVVIVIVGVVVPAARRFDKPDCFCLRGLCWF